VGGASVGLGLGLCDEGCDAGADEDADDAPDVGAGLAALAERCLAFGSALVLGLGVPFALALGLTDGVVW